MILPDASGHRSPLHDVIETNARRARFVVVQPPAGTTGLPPVSSLLAGVAQVDITPPPGMPKAGYSANAHDGVGFRTRLRATVLHLRNGHGSIALVQCDLLGGSSVVQHLVADAIAPHTDVALGGLFLGATHTHAGPGQYLGTDFYNRFASNRSGFDPDYAQFLVDRIAGAVIEAVATREAAVLATGIRDVWGFTRNRSLDAHVRNHTVTDASTRSHRKFAAVNPQLHLVRVDRVAPDTEAGSTPLSAHVIFSVHGTGIPMASHDYNADLWAYLTGELAHRVEGSTGVRIPVGAMEGTHADVAPALRPGTAGHIEAGRLGRSLGEQAAILHAELGAHLRSDVSVGAAFREIDLDRPESRRCGGVEIPRRPAVGASLVAGAHENLTPVIHRIPPFRAGVPKPLGYAGAQGRKWVLGTRWLQPVVLPQRGFPSVIPVHLLQIGMLGIVGLPFEITVETGRRIRDAVLPAMGSRGVSNVAVSSVANEYYGYAATHEEYDRQHYEGGHTLFGPNSQRWLGAQSVALAHDSASTTMYEDAVPRRTFDLHVVRHLRRAHASNPPTALAARWRFATHAIYVDPTSVEDGHWEVHLTGPAPGQFAWHQPIVWVEQRTEEGWQVARAHDGVRVDDQGWQLQVNHRPSNRGVAAHRYVVRWWDPTPLGGGTYRFVVNANVDREPVVSAPFP